MADHLNDREQENRSSSKSQASDPSIYLLTLSYEIAGMASGLNHLCRIKPMFCIGFFHPLRKSTLQSDCSKLFLATQFG